MNTIMLNKGIMKLHLCRLLKNAPKKTKVGKKSNVYY